jgi:RNA polymerase sigma-70 factor (ECF subfamily)
MLQGFPGVHRWAQTDDVLQSALMRLLRALEAVRPKTVRELFGLSTEMIRRELLDLARHYYGPQGLGANYASSDGQAEGAGPAHDRGDLTFEPSALAGWRELHEQVQNLPEPERETFMLLFYQELPQAQVAELLGVSVRQVQRRWQSALLSLHKVLKGQWPGL